MNSIAALTLLGLFSAQNPNWDVSSLYQEALKVNPSASAALQAVVQAQQHVAELNAQRRMQLTFTGSASANHGTESFAPTSASFSTFQGTVSLPILNNGRIQAQVDQANAQLKVAQGELLRARLTLAFNASDAYYGVLRARGSEQIAEQTYEQAQRQVADAQKRVDDGDLAPSEVLKAQVPESQAKAALAVAKSQVRVAEETLDSLVHHELAEVPNLSEAPELSTFDLTLVDAHQQASQHSPDALEADANVVVAEAAVAQARRARDPDFTLQASQTHTTDPTTYANLTTLNLSFDLPFSDGGVARRQFNEANAQLQQAKAQRDAAYQTLDLAVDQAYLDYLSDSANLASSQDTLKIAEDSYNKAEQAYTAGLTTTRDVLDAGVALSQARNDVNSATYDLALARAKLDQVIGREPAQ